MKNKNDTKSIDFKSDIVNLGFEIVELKSFYNVGHSSIKLARVINFYVILFITQGKGIHEIDFETYEYNKDNILFINKGQEHRWIEYENSNGYLLIFTEKFLEKHQVKFKDLSYWFFDTSYLYKPILHFNKEISQPLQTLLKSLYIEYNLPFSKHKDEILQCLFRTFLLKVNTNLPQSKIDASEEQKEIFINFHNTIDIKINQSRNINDYCKWLKIPYKKLNETCKIFTNNTAKNHLDTMLLLKAKQLLIDNKKNISEISFLLGFYEPTNFTKFFKKHTSYSPKEFKKTLRLI